MVTFVVAAALGDGVVDSSVVILPSVVLCLRVARVVFSVVAFTCLVGARVVASFIVVGISVVGSGLVLVTGDLVALVFVVLIDDVGIPT